jgi:carbon-monoxide dehydrogenase medium subunit
VKPASFAYEAPTTLREAAALLSEHGPDAKLIAGGQSLVPVLALRLARFDTLVDLNGVDELDYVRHADGNLVVGAMTRQATIESDRLVARYAPVLARATRHIGHFQIRNRGTIGGSISHADPAAEYPAVALAMDAVMHVTSKNGSRTARAVDFFTGPMTSEMAEDEILDSISFPVWSPGSGFSVQEVARREGDFAAAGVVAGVTVEDGIVSRAGVALFGVAGTPTRTSAAEATLTGQPVGSLDLTEIGRLALADVDAVADIHASVRYRTQVGARLVTKALAEAISEATTEAAA